MRFRCGVLLLLGVGVAVAAAQTGATWDYTGKNGPLNWNRVDPSYRACGSGHEQSPIDLRGAHLNKNLAPLEFHYKAGSVTLENDGHTIIAHVPAGSYFVADGVRYELESFSFHHPSEHAVKGSLSDMDVELLHRSADGKLAVVAVRFAMERGDPNAVMAALWPHLPKTAGSKEKVSEFVNAGGFLPIDRGYWTYSGSLTAPPCTEGVRWFIFQEPLSVSLVQLHEFQQIFKMNSRPLQDKNGRRVDASE
ncbi:MAG: carbonic anhydrase family protein [Terracidiphilus sp.]|nr:carbonic anhydrase family protein [Terracidiphilus sp.]